MVFIDAILLAKRLGNLTHDEQKVALVAAARAATDALGFMRAAENFGISRNSRLHSFLGQMLAAPAYYRSQYPIVLGLRPDGTEAESFLSSQRVMFMVEGILTMKQYDAFQNAYQWFVNNHYSYFISRKSVKTIGLYSTEPKDNESTLQRFEEYMTQLINSKKVSVIKQFEAFPLDIVLAILKRAFL